MFDSSPRPVKISKPKFLKLDFKVLLILLLSLTFGIYGLSGGIVNAASTIVVTSSGDATADDGVCTLREAITAANDDTASGATPGECIAGSGADTINFNIPGSGIHRITPMTLLPDITETISIDGTTQPGTNCEPRNLKIELDFTTAYATQNKARAFVFDRDVDDNSLQGLSIFGDSDGAAGGGQEDQGITFNKSDGNTVRCNNIGLMADGKRPSVELGYTNNRAGLKFWVGSDNNLVGGNTLADRNIFSDNYEGINNSCEVSGGGNMENLKIVGNYFGTDVTGMLAYPNRFTDIAISCGDKVQIGGSGAGERNIFSGGSSGTSVSLSSTTGVEPNIGTKIQGNFFGLNVAGQPGSGFATANSAVSVIVLPNSVFGNADSANTESLIGGTAPGEGNTIVGFDSGVTISTGYFDFGGGPLRSIFIPVNHTVIGNTIYGNDFGIELCDLNVGNPIAACTTDGGPNPNDTGDPDTGANDYLNTPEITAIKQNGNQITFTYDLDVIGSPSDQYRVEFFSNDAADSHGYGQGQNMLGSTTATASGPTTGLQATFTLPSDQDITSKVFAATTTVVDASLTYGFGSTSEFGKVTDGAVTSFTAAPANGSGSPSIAQDPSSDSKVSNSKSTLASTGSNLNSILVVGVALCIAGALVPISSKLRLHFKA